MTMLDFFIISPGWLSVWRRYPFVFVDMVLSVAPAWRKSFCKQFFCWPKIFDWQQWSWWWQNNDLHDLLIKGFSLNVGVFSAVSLGWELLVSQRNIENEYYLKKKKRKVPVLFSKSIYFKYEVFFWKTLCNLERHALCSNFLSNFSVGHFSHLFIFLLNQNTSERVYFLIY